ncbi:MAG: hypothetical protein EOM80_09835 [Erysipelotrichia bacterium]|nr:hypothetical protein [Erysipelotrichia bacterium]
MKSPKWFFYWLLVLAFSLTAPFQPLLAQSAADVFGENLVKISADSNSSSQGSDTRTGKGSMTGTVVVSPSLNVRAGVWGTIIGALYNGNKVTIVNQEGDWYQINYGSGQAFVHSDYVVIDGASSAAANSQITTGIVHVSPSLNIRTSPWGAVIGSFYEGDKVTIVGQEGDWYKISLNGQIVYCHSDYITKSGASTQTTSSSQTTASISGVQSGANGKVVLNVPQQCQGAVNCPVPWSACGPTSLGMALAYYGKGNAGSLAANLWYTCGTTGAAGTSHAGLAKGAQQNGFPNAKWDYSVGLSWVKEQIKAGKPVIANVYNHYVVITGIDDSGNIYYNDPAKWDVVQVKSYDSFSAWWNGGGCYHAAMTLQ